MQNLTQHVGVEEIEVVEEIHLAPRSADVGGRSVILHVEQFERAILVTYNQLNTNDGDLAGIIAAAGFAVRAPERLGRVGRQIIIPRDVTV